MKKKILFLISMMLIGTFSTACTDDETNSIPTKERYPLTSFAVKIGDSYYHGKIDQSTHRVEIGTIENANTITDVEYTLINNAATITPDPQTFLGKWKDEQIVTITTEDNKTTDYTIALTKYKEPVENILFIDNFDVDGTPDPTKWSLCKKSTSDWCDEMSESYDQAYIKDGKLILKAEKVNGVYKAGGIETKDKFSFTYGRVEVRARISQYPNGAFPAIWMMPQKAAYTGWPKCGEIDIMEHIKQEPHIHQTIHTNYTYNLGIKDPASSKKVTCNFEEYNLYAVEWTKDAITFYVNGQQTFSYPNLRLADEAEKMQWPFNKESAFYLILNMGLGGNKADSWAGPIDDNNLPATMEVDWIKVTKLPDTVVKRAVIGYLYAPGPHYDTQFPSIDWQYLTHVNVCFALVKSDGTFDLAQVTNKIDEIRDIAHRNNVKVLISMREKAKGEISKAMANPTTKAQLIKTIVEYTLNKQLDGFDFDYEEHDNTANNESYQILLSFVKDLHAAKDPDMLMTCAAYGRWLYYGTEWADYFDYINLMSYDRNNANHSETPVQHATLEDLQKDLADWETRWKAPKNKIIGGIPFYGYTWNPELLKITNGTKTVSYYDILNFFGDEAAKIDYIGNTYYNGMEMMRKKCEYIKNNNYGGVMIWQLLHDASPDKKDLRLLKAIGESIN